MTAETLNVLLIEDDKEDYLIVKQLFRKIPERQFKLEWASDYDSGLEAIRRGGHDVCLLDYRLDDRDGLDLLSEAVKINYPAPIIVLTGIGDYRVDLEAMQRGAADYLVKGQIEPTLLERAIRYSIERKRSAEKLEQSREELRRLSNELLRAQETERKRLALELHDGVGQLLAANRFALEHFFDELDEETRLQHRNSMERVTSMMQQAVEEVRDVSSNLRPPVLDDSGIINAVEWLCREFSQNYPDIEVHREIQRARLKLREEVQISLFRILQEALYNAARHSGARSIHVKLVSGQGGIRLQVRDDGRGFQLDASNGGHPLRRGMGLSSMKERAELSGGTFRIESIPGDGTIIKASWPLEGEGGS